MGTVNDKQRRNGISLFGKLRGFLGRDSTRNQNTPQWVKDIVYLVAFVLLAVFLSFLAKTFLLRVFLIPSGSMENTLQVEDRIFVNQLVPTPFDIQRGDILVFQDSAKWLPEKPSQKTDSSWLHRVMVFAGLKPDLTQQHLVKRAIGVAGDRVICCDEEGRITVNGESLDEPYIYPGASPSDLKFDVTVPEGNLWMMGDHRNASTDSRFYQVSPSKGFIDVDDVKGKAFLIGWPSDRVTLIEDHSDVFANVPETQ